MGKKILDLNIFFSTEQMVAICLDYYQATADIVGSEYANVNDNMGETVMKFLIAYCLNNGCEEDEEAITKMLDKLQNDRYTEKLLRAGKIEAVFLEDGSIDYKATQEC